MNKSGIKESEQQSFSTKKDGKLSKKNIGAEINVHLSQSLSAASPFIKRRKVDLASQDGSHWSEL